MRDVLRHLREAAREDWRPGPYLGAALLLALGFWINYGLDFKQEALRAYRPLAQNTLFYLVFYAVPYLGTLALTTLRTGQARLWRTRSFWLLTAFVLLTLALNRAALRLPRLWIGGPELGPAEVEYWQRCAINGVRLLALGGPVALFWLLFQRDTGHFYGVRRRGFHARPYLSMLAIMVPPIVWASFRPDFLSVYPLLRPEVAARIAEHRDGLSPGLAFGLHEVFYAMRFIGVEIFFRGFMVLGLVRWFGPSTLLPMVVLYAFWHFGKPFPEALGSVFGAYVLGILALRTRTIAGGILLHMGIALLMDLAAYLQHRWN